MPGRVRASATGRRYRLRTLPRIGEPLRESEPKLWRLSPIIFAASRMRCSAIVSRVLALPYLRFIRAAILTLILQDVEPRVPVGGENQPVGSDVQIGGFRR